MHPGLLRMIKILLIGFISAYMLIIAFVYVRQGKMLYYPLREIGQTPKDIGLDYEDLQLRTKDGLLISAWYVPADFERAVLLFCHGNAGNISHRLDSIRIFHDLGLSVLIFDYRGYGKSEGSPDEEGTYRDAEAGYDYLTNQRGVSPEKIVLFGRSLGSAVAAETALRRTAGALIVESGFTSVPDLGRHYYPFLPVRLISRYHYTTIEKIVRIAAPKLLIHSPDDEIIPFSHGEALFAKAGDPKKFLAIRGGHNDGFLISGEAYVDGIRSFLVTHLRDERNAGRE